MNATRLLRLASRLDSIAKRGKAKQPIRFDITCWYGETECGTAACAIGFAALLKDFNDEGFRFIRAPGINPIPTFQGTYAWHAVERFFEIDYSDASYLFGSIQHPATPRSVAKRIRGFVSMRIALDKVAKERELLVLK